MEVTSSTVLKRFRSVYLIAEIQYPSATSLSNSVDLPAPEAPHKINNLLISAQLLRCTYILT